MFSLFTSRLRRTCIVDLSALVGPAFTRFSVLKTAFVSYLSIEVATHPPRDSNFNFMIISQIIEPYIKILDSSSLNIQPS